MIIGPTAAELADLITDDVKAMPDTATVLRSTSVRSAGGFSQTFLPVTTQVVTPQILALFPSIAPGTTPCRLTASVLSGGTEEPGAGELVSIMAYTLVMPPGTDVRPADQVQITGSTFEAKAIKGAASWNLSDSVTLAEIRH